MQDRLGQVLTAESGISHSQQTLLLYSPELQVLVVREHKLGRLDVQA